MFISCFDVCRVQRTQCIPGMFCKLRYVFACTTGPTLLTCSCHSWAIGPPRVLTKSGMFEAADGRAHHWTHRDARPRRCVAAPLPSIQSCYISKKARTGSGEWQAKPVVLESRSPKVTCFGRSTMLVGCCGGFNFSMMQHRRWRNSVV
jgi:hypothetical protein